jgi:hypothetical protein
MDELVELERVDLAGVVTLEALAHMFEQPRELALVISADGRTSRAPLSLRRTELNARAAAGSLFAIDCDFCFAIAAPAVVTEPSVRADGDHPG